VETSTTIDVEVGPDTLIVQTVDDAGLAGGENLALIGDELVAFRTVAPITGGIRLTGCVRGVLDTVPDAHTAGARVWFLSYGHALIGILGPGVGTDVRFTAWNNTTRIATGSAPVETITADNPDRALRPYPPTAVEFNGAAYPASITGELTVSWEHRNRLASWSYADAGIAASPEAGPRTRSRSAGNWGPWSTRKPASPGRRGPMPPRRRSPSPASRASTITSRSRSGRRRRPRGRFRP
jgi:hypothetical protein